MEFDRDGKFIRGFGDGFFDRPHGLRIDAQDNIWTTDVASHVVYKMNPQGRIQLMLGNKGAAGEFHPYGHLRLLNEPNDVAVAPNGEIYVVQGHGRAEPRVLKFDRDGNFIKAWGKKGKGPGEFDIAHSIAIDAKGLVYVADRNNSASRCSTPTARSCGRRGIPARPAACSSRPTRRLARARSRRPGAQARPRRQGARRHGQAGPGPRPVRRGAFHRGECEERDLRRRHAELAGAEIRAEGAVKPSHWSECNMNDRNTSVDRRKLLGGGALAVLGVTGAALHRRHHGQGRPKAKGKAAANAVRVSQAVAEFVAGFDLKTAPQPVIDRARMVFIDSVGVMLAGSHEEAVHFIVAMVKAEGSAPQASIVQESLRASPQLAAFANGVANHAMDYDFTYMRAQAIAALIPAILPVAETTKATPAEIVAAFIIGAEVASRFVRVDQDGPMFVGWHTVGMVGVLGAAAACARLMQVPAAAIPNVMSMAASLASGFAANFATMTKPLHCGNAARNGVLAATLGKAGYTANPAAFEGRNGYFQTFGRGIDVSLDGFKDLGSHYDLQRPLSLQGLSVRRPHPHHHRGRARTAAACRRPLRRHQEHPLRRFVRGRPARVDRLPLDHRAGEIQRRLSGAVCAGARRAADRGLHRQGARRRASQGDPAQGHRRRRARARPRRRRQPGEIRITMTDGQVFEARKDFSTGSVKLPMTQAQLEDKFYDCAAVVMDKGRAAKILAILNELPAARRSTTSGRCSVRRERGRFSSRVPGHSHHNH